MNMRGKIAGIIWHDRQGQNTPESVADAILATIKANVPELVWVTWETSAISTCGRYKVYELDSGIGGTFRAIYASFGTQYISDHRDSADPRNAMKAAKAAAQAHHVAQKTDWMGVE